MPTRIEMQRSELQLRHAALPAFPEAPGERLWFDRMRTFDGFLAAAPTFVDWMARASADDVAKCRHQFPALFTLAFDACDSVPPTADARRPCPP
jgi:hypothetical protein